MSFEQLVLDFAAPAVATCGHCGEEFTPSDSKTKYCNRGCNRAASAERIARRDSEARLIAGTQIGRGCKCLPHGLIFRNGSPPECAKCGRRAKVAEVVEALRERHRRPRR